MNYFAYLDNYEHLTKNKTISLVVFQTDDYGVLITMYKKNTLYDMYKNIALLFESDNFVLKDEQGAKIPKSTSYIHDFLKENKCKPLEVQTEHVLYKIKYEKTDTETQVVTSHESHY